MSQTINNIENLEEFVVNNWSSKATLRKGSYGGDPEGNSAYGAEEDLLYDYDSKEFYRKVNGVWEIAFQSNVVVSAEGSTSIRPEDEINVPRVTLLSFDYESGIFVEEPDLGELRVRSEPSFKTVTVDDQSDVVAVGRGTLNLISGSLIEVITDPDTNSISFNLLEDNLSIDYSQITNAPELPDLSDVATSGSYTDLTDKPTLFSGSYIDLIDKPDLSSVAISGSYTDLSDLPTLFSGSYNDLTDKPTLFSGSYNDLTDTPDFSSIAFSGSYTDLVDVPDFSSIAFSGSYTDLTDVPDFSSIALSGSYTDLTDVPDFSTVAISGSYNDLTDKPTLFSGSYHDLTNKPSLFSGSYNALSDKPIFSDVATSGSYEDLEDRPFLSDVATSGSYNDLLDIPDLSEFQKGSTIFLVNVQSLESGKEVSLTWDQEESYSITSFSTTTNQVRLEVEVEGGESYRGDYTANGVPFLSYNQLSPSRRFLGTVDLTLGEEDEILIEGNGGSLTIPFTRNEAPSVTRVSFDLGSYPNGQTELKEGDMIDVEVEADKNFDLVEIQNGNSNALKSVSQTVSPTSSTTVSFEVADRGASLQQLGTTLRVRGSETGSLSSWRSSDNNVAVNNLYPSITWGSITYPTSQTALKNSEEARVDYTITDYDSFSVSSTELDVDLAGPSEAIVNLNSVGQSQGYRDSGTNLTVTAERDANGSSSTASQLVHIAHVPPTTFNPNPRFRTDSSPKTKNINFSFDQDLLSLSLDGSIPEGTNQGISGSNDSWSVSIEISNSNAHSSNPYFFLVESVNKAGIATDHSLSYRIQGFFPITQNVQTTNTLITSLPMSVVNPDNLVVTSEDPPITFNLVESFSDGPKPEEQFKFESGDLEFNSAITFFLTNTEPVGLLILEVEEI